LTSVSRIAEGATAGALAGLAASAVAGAVAGVLYGLAEPRIPGPATTLIALFPVFGIALGLALPHARRILTRRPRPVPVAR